MKKILVVDDERPISDIIKFNLTKEVMKWLRPLMGEKLWNNLKLKTRLGYSGLDVA